MRCMVNPSVDYLFEKLLVKQSLGYLGRVITQTKIVCIILYHYKFYLLEIINSHTSKNVSFLLLK